MQVSHVQDHCTHAVIGGKETIDFGISSSAEFFNILSSTLYKDQKLAVVREVLCNAWDAHIEAGCTDRPVQITLDSEKLVIKDFGKGIHHEDMGPIYGTYGNSTKKNDGMQTGGFGLGCKSPFAYTDHFEVISCHDGVKTIYNLSKSSAQAQGKPGIIPIASFPTDETGLTVSIRIKAGDHGRFVELIKRTVRNGDMNMLLNGEVLPKLGFDTSKGNYLIVREEPLMDSYSRILVRYGNVVYPVDTASALSHQYKAIGDHLDKMPGHCYNRIVFQAPPHSISVTPSRESLSMQEHTVQTLQKLFDGFLAMLQGEFLVVCDAHAKELVAEAVAEKQVGELLKKQAGMPHTKGWEAVPKISDLASMAQVYLRFNYPRGLEYRKADLTNRLNLMAQHNLLDRGKVQTFLRALKDVQTNLPESHGCSNIEKSSWLQRRVIAPLLSKLSKAGLDTEKLFICDSEDLNYFSNNREKSPPLVPATRVKPRHLLNTLPYLRNIVVLTTRRYDLVNSAYEDEVFTTLGKYQGFMVYTLGRKAGEIEAARKFFATSGMVVVELTDKPSDENTVRTTPAKPRKPAKKGLVCLSTILTGNTINTQNSREEDAARIESPEFVVKISVRADMGNTYLPNWYGKASRNLVELFGDKGGVTSSSTMHDNWLKRGAKDFDDYVREKICSYILFNPRIGAYWANHQERTLDAVGSRYEHSSLVRLIYENPLLSKEFGLVSTLTDEDAKYLQLWEVLVDVHRYRTCPEIIKVKDWLKSIPIDPVATELANKLKNSPLISLLDVYQADRVLQRDDKLPEYQKTIDFIISLINN